MSRTSIHLRLSKVEKARLESALEDYREEDLTGLLNKALRGKINLSRAVEDLSHNTGVRTEMVHIYMPPRDKDEVSYQASFWGMSTSEYVRRVIYGQISETVID